MRILLASDAALLKHAEVKRLHEYASGEVLVEVPAHLIDPDMETSIQPGHQGLKTKAPEPSVTMESLPPDEEVMAFISLIGPADKEWLQKLADNQIELIQYQPEFTYLAKAPARLLQNLVEQYFFVEQVQFLHDSLKNSPVMPETGMLNSRLIINGKFEDAKAIISKIDALNEVEVDFESIAPIDNQFFSCLAMVGSNGRDHLLRMPLVLAIEAYEEATLEGEIANLIIVDELNDQRKPEGDYLDWLDAIDVSGKDVTISVVDTGVDESHPGFKDRINKLSVGQKGWHGTAVAGAAAGNYLSEKDGDGFRGGLGMAPDANVIDQSFSQITQKVAQVCQTAVNTEAPNGQSAQIQNNSWGAGTNSPMNYTALEATYDRMVRNSNPDGEEAKPLVICFSAGNSGKAGLTRPKAAKNIIVTGNSENIHTKGGTNSDNIDEVYNDASGGPSSEGNCGDGRLKPDIVAPGQFSLSTGFNVSPGSKVSDTGLLTFFYGTSAASPKTAGACALLVEWWKKHFNGHSPSPALVKALLVNSANLLPDQRSFFSWEASPNNLSGWGRLNMDRAITPRSGRFHLDQSEMLSERGQSWSKAFTINDTDQPVKVTLTWTDPPGSLFSGDKPDNPAIINRLILKVTAKGKVYYGNVFSGAWSQPGRPGNDADLGKDNLQNIYLPADLVDEGFTVEVEAFNVTTNCFNYSVLDPNQDFALVVLNVNEENEYGAEPITPPDEQEDEQDLKDCYHSQIGNGEGQDPVNSSSSGSESSYWWLTSESTSTESASVESGLKYGTMNPAILRTSTRPILIQKPVTLKTKTPKATVLPTAMSRYNHQAYSTLKILPQTTLSGSLTYRPIPPKVDLSPPFRIGKYIIRSEEQTQTIYYHLDKPQLVDFSLTLIKKEDSSIHTDHAKVSLVFQTLQEEHSDDIYILMEENWELIQSSTGFDTRSWKIKALDLNSLSVDLRLPESPSASNGLLSTPDISVNTTTGQVIALMNIEGDTADEWYEHIKDARPDRIGGIVSISGQYYAGDERKVFSEPLNIQGTLSELLQNIDLNDVKIIQPKVNLNCKILVQGHELIQSVSITCKPSNGEAPQTFVLDHNGGEIDVNFHAQTAELEALTVDIDYKIDYRVVGWPVINRQKQLSVADNNWTEMIDPASWIRQYTLIATLIDETGNVLPQSEDATDRIICELNYRAGFMEEGSFISEIFETGNQLIRKIDFPLPEQAGTEEIKLTATALREGPEGQFLPPNIEVRELSANASLISIQVNADASIHIESNDGPQVESGPAAQNSGMRLLERLGASMVKRDPSVESGEPGAVTESSTAQFNKLLRYLDTTEAAFSENEPWYFWEMEKMLIDQAVIDENFYVDRDNFHEAIEAFQAKANLTVDGIPGQDTLWALQYPYFCKNRRQVIKVEADVAPGYEKGYDFFRLRDDAVPYYNDLKAELNYYGGLITSSGSRRSLSAKVTAGRSSTSIHYSGAAFDLYVGSGMKNPNRDPFIIVADGKKWIVYSRVTEGGEIMELDAAVYSNGRLTTRTVTAQVMNFTELAGYYGFKNISRRSCFPNDYMCAEWWHFQNEFVITPYLSQFGIEVLSLNDIDIRKMKNTHLWKNRKKIFKRNWF